MPSPPKKRLRGYSGLYPRYVRILKRKRKATQRQNARTRHLLRDDIRKLDCIISEMNMLHAHKIETAGQLYAHKAAVLTRIETLMEQRDDLRRLCRRQESAGHEDEIRGEIAALTKRLRDLRMEAKRCDNIAERSGAIREKLDTLSQNHEEKTKEKTYGRIR